MHVFSSPGSWMYRGETLGQWGLEAALWVSRVFSCCWQWMFHVACSVLHAEHRWWVGLSGWPLWAQERDFLVLVTCGMKEGVDKAGRGMDEEVPVATISKQPAVMLLWLLEQICLQTPGKPHFPVLTGFVLVRRVWPCRLQVKNALPLFSIWRRTKSREGGTSRQLVTPGSHRQHAGSYLFPTLLPIPPEQQATAWDWVLGWG